MNLERLLCQACGLVFASPFPDPDKLDDYNSRFFQTAYGLSTLSKNTDSFYRGMAKARFTYIQSYLQQNHIHVERILEIGPGLGHMAELWLSLSETKGYSAVETDKSCHAHLQQLGVNLLEQNDRRSSRVDLVIMSHVLEHVVDPFIFICQSTCSLRNGGVLFVEVPCRDFEYKQQDESHVLFFDKPSLKQLFDRCSFSNSQQRYFGQTIDFLKKKRVLRQKWLVVRARLIRLGLVSPFVLNTGLDASFSSLEKAMIKPFLPYYQQDKPAWWLRSIAIKQD